MRILAWLTLAVLGLAAAPLPIRADSSVLAWQQIGKPGSSGYIVVSPSEVNEIAVGSGVIYAVDSSENATKLSAVYRSNNSGASWDDISSSLQAAGAVLPAGKIAIAPDTSGVVAAVTDNDTDVYVSLNAGDTWFDTRVPDLGGTYIQAIAISRQYAEGGLTLREVVIGTAHWGDATTTGRVWVLKLGAVSSEWQDQGLTIDPLLPGGEVSAIVYSPDFLHDDTMIVVASTGADVRAGYQNKTWLCLGQRNTAAGSTSWHVYSGYPVAIGTAASPSAGDAPGVSLKASLAVPANFSGSDETLRQVFVSYDREPDASDDVYRVDDTTVTRLDAAGGATINIVSLAYSGTTDSGKLLAGLVDPAVGTRSVPVRRTFDPQDAVPTWTGDSMPPIGPGNAIVAWDPSGETVYCGTSTSHGEPAPRDESSFSMSIDNGDNWQQISLIDTTFTISGVIPSPNSDSLFVATYSTFGPEGIWRTANTTRGIGVYWTRQLTMDTTTNRVILRMSPSYTADYTLYAFEAGGTQVAFSHDRGNSWKRRQVPGDVIDATVASADTAYVALPGGIVRKSTNNAFIWSQPVYTGINDINMITTVQGNTVLVGGRNGEIAVSTDGGVVFNVLGAAIGTGDVQVAADVDFADNGIIYAATTNLDGGIWRWQLGSSTEWRRISEALTSAGSGISIGSLAENDAGTLYALRREPAGADTGGLARSLNPTTDPELVEFTTANAGLPAGAAFDATTIFGHNLPFLGISADSGATDLWSLDTANEIIYRFRDSLASVAPQAVVPADGAEIAINTINNAIPTIAFSWTRPSLATAYYLEIALDPALDQLIVPPIVVGPDVSDTLTLIVTPAMAPLAPGSTYYWAVRATAPLLSPWSVVRSFTIQPVPAVVPAIETPTNGASVSASPAFSWGPVAGATAYELQLSTSTGFETTLYDEQLPTSGALMPSSVNLEPGHTYFWRVRASGPVAGPWSAVANFTITSEPIAPSPTPPVVLTVQPTPTVPVPAPIQTIVVTQYESSSFIVPAYLWAGIGVGGALLVLVVILILRTRR